jgi:DNA end-binding protein Ku
MVPELFVPIYLPENGRGISQCFGLLPGEKAGFGNRYRARKGEHTKTGHFKPDEFEDRYEDGLKELLRKKDKGEKIEAPHESRSDNVVNLMDALRRSVQGERAPATHSRRQWGPHRRKSARKHSTTHHRKAG